MGPYAKKPRTLLLDRRAVGYVCLHALAFREIEALRREGQELVNHDAIEQWRHGAELPSVAGDGPSHSDLVTLARGPEDDEPGKPERGLRSV
jgi:hypothetical protein